MHHWFSELQEQKSSLSLFLVSVFRDSDKALLLRASQFITQKPSQQSGMKELCVISETAEGVQLARRYSPPRPHPCLQPSWRSGQDLQFCHRYNSQGEGALQMTNFQGLAALLVPCHGVIFSGAKSSCASC